MLPGIAVALSGGWPLLFLFYLLPLRASAQADCRLYTLDELVRRGLEQNLSLQNARLDVAISENALQEAKSGLLPQVTAEGQYQYYFDVPTSLVPASVFGGPPETYSAVQFQVPQSTTGNLKVSQLLYNQPAITGLKIARAATKLSELSVRKTREDVVYDITTSYYGAQSLYLSIALLQRQIAALQKVAADTELRVREGVAKKTDLQQTQVSVQNLKTQVVNLSNTYNQLLGVLKLNGNIPQTESICIDTSLSGETPEFIRTADTVSIRNRTDLLQLQQTRELQLLEKKSVGAGYFPTLTAFASFGVNGFNGEFNPFRNLNDKWYPVNLAGLSLSIPLFDGFEKVRSNRGKILQLRKTETSIGLVRESARMELQNAVATYNANVQSLADQQLNQQLARELYAQVELQYREGRSSVTDLLNAQNELLEAQTNYLDALVKVRTARLDLKRAGGTLLEP